ncbi:hypothetical protein [Dyella japonica]|uniref:hypothetical protein n=1 Tax=Dyella japonica TaxID=231455 RepID=UPI000AAECAC4|nr:hypothetical protein [Dyella japonica]
MSYASSVKRLQQPSGREQLHLKYPGAIYDESYLSGTGNPYRLMISADRFPVVVVHDLPSVSAAIQFIKSSNHRATPVHALGTSKPISDQLRLHATTYMLVAKTSAYRELTSRADICSTHFQGAQMQNFQAQSPKAAATSYVPLDVARRLVRWMPGGATLELPYLRGVLQGNELRAATNGGLILTSVGLNDPDLTLLANERQLAVAGAPGWILSATTPLKVVV